jgi:hypothetical protein
MSPQQTLNILALQQQQLHQQQQNDQLQQLHQHHQQDNNFQQNQNHQHHQQRDLHQQLDGLHSSNNNHGHNNSNPTLEQLHAQLAASLAAKQQTPMTANSLSASALNLATSMNAPMNASSTLRSNVGQSADPDNPASAALKAQLSSTPATAAMDAASATTNANSFEASANLQSLLSQNGGMHRQASFAATGPNQRSLLNRLPSANTIFPENMSTASFGNLLGSSNRLSSLLSLNSFLGSREPSMADFAAATGMPPNMNAQQFAAEFAASGANGVSQSYAENKYRSS